MLLQLFNLTGAKRHSHLHLSSTHKKKLAMAMALASHPSFLVLDEPTNGMDVETVKQFWRNLQVSIL
jgi:ABC-type multidrug transport system ATPase subunit